MTDPEPRGAAPPSWLPGAAVALAALAGVGALIPGFGPRLTAGAAGPPFSFEPAAALLGISALLLALAASRERFRAAALLAIVLLGFGLRALEVRTASAPWHRSTPQPFGLSPDLLLAVAAGLVAAGRRAHLGASVALVAALAMMLVPVPVRAVYHPALLAAGGDPGASGGMALAAGLHLGLAGLLGALLLYPRLQERATPGLLAGSALLLWAALTALPGLRGGWSEPIGTWPAAGHAVIRLGALGAAGGAAWMMSSWRAAAGGAAQKAGPGAERVAAALILGVFLLLKWQGMHWANTDENIYFYAGEAATRGLLPYRDYFYAHPPLRVAIPALLFGTLGFSLGTAEAIAPLSAAVASLLLWRAVRRHAGPLGGLTAMALFLGAAEVLKASTDFTGINLTNALAMGALLAALRRRGLLSGLLLAAATGVGMISLWWVPVLGLHLALTSRRSLLRFGVGLGAGLLLIHGAGLLIGGGAYVDGVFRYHGLKAVKIPGHSPVGFDDPLGMLLALPGNLGALLGSRSFFVFLFYHGVLAWLSLAAALYLLAGPTGTWVRRRLGGGRKRVALASCDPEPEEEGATDRVEKGGAGAAIWPLALISGLAFLGLLREVFDFYWVILIPVLAALVPVAVSHLWARWRSEPRSPRWQLPLAAMLLLPGPAVRQYGQSTWPKEIAAAGKLKRFPWLDSAPSPALDGLTASLFFKSHRVQGELEPGLHHYLWSKKRSFSTAERLAETVRKLVPEGGTLTGASTLAPLLALLSGRRLAADEVDTNSKVFKTGMRQEADFWEQACDDGLSLIVSAPRSYFSRRRMRRVEPVRQDFRRLGTTQDPTLLHWKTFPITLYGLRRGRKRCGPTRSRAIPATGR